MKEGLERLAIVGALLCALTGGAWACNAGSLEGLITVERIRGYGRMTALFTAGIFYLQLRRVGLKNSTFYLLALFIPIYAFNEGWHYRALAGDCGGLQLLNAFCFMVSIGGLLAHQIIAAMRTAARRKSETAVHIT